MPAQWSLPRRHLLWRYLITDSLLDLHFSLRFLLSSTSFLHSFHTYYQLSIAFGRLGFPSPMSTFLLSHLPLLKYTFVLVSFYQCLGTRVFHSHLWPYKTKWKNMIDLNLILSWAKLCVCPSSLNWQLIKKWTSSSKPFIFLLKYQTYLDAVNA